MESTDPRAILADVRSMTGALLDQWGWADDEIELAQARHPGSADQLHHCFALLWSTHDGMSAERVHRAHCRELLDRVVEGGDPREATAAEVVLACHDVSLVTPINSPAVVVYMRAWQLAFPGTPAFAGRELRSYEHVAGSRADELERDTYRRLRRPERVLLAPGECSGRHHRTPAPMCPYAREA